MKYFFLLVGSPKCHSFTNLLLHFSPYSTFPQPYIKTIFMITYEFRPIIFQSINFSILSEFMIKYWKNNMFSLIYQSGMSSMMFTGAF
jgi:hypothetical protein